MTNSTVNGTVTDPQLWKEKGNLAFKNGDWVEACECYTRAIQQTKEDTPEKAVYYKNRAAVHLKKGEYTEARDDCTAALDIIAYDPKALFRRCQALEALENFEEAYRDAKQIHTVDPGNKAIQPILERLHQIVQDRMQQNAQTTNKVAQMFRYAFDMEEEKEKRETATNNLLVLAREKAGAEIMYKNGIVNKICNLLKVEKDKNMFLSGVRIVGELCKNSMERTKGVLQEVGIPWFIDILNSRQEAQVNASQYCIQTIFNSLSGMDNKPDSKPHPELCEQNKKELDTLLTCLVCTVTSRTISGLARDAVLELITRNVHYSALNWAERLIEIQGLHRLLEVASELEEYKYESAMEITSSTHTIASVCLARIYENMYYEDRKSVV